MNGWCSSTPGMNGVKARIWSQIDGMGADIWKRLGMYWVWRKEKRMIGNETERDRLDLKPFKTPSGQGGGGNNGVSKNSPGTPLSGLAEKGQDNFTEWE